MRVLERIKGVIISSTTGRTLAIENEVNSFSYTTEPSLVTRGSTDIKQYPAGTVNVMVLMGAGTDDLVEITAHTGQQVVVNVAWVPEYAGEGLHLLVKAKGTNVPYLTFGDSIPPHHVIRLEAPNAILRDAVVDNFRVFTKALDALEAHKELWSTRAKNISEVSALIEAVGYHHPLTMGVEDRGDVYHEYLQSIIDNL